MIYDNKANVVYVHVGVNNPFIKNILNWKGSYF